MEADDGPDFVPEAEPDFYDNGDEETPSESEDDSTSSNSKKKQKTFNDLDERFQLKDHHDPEHIFPEEYDMIAELRKRIPELDSHFSDKFLVFFLCARRHNVDETEELLKRYMSKRKELGLENQHTPDVFAEAGVVKMLFTKVAYRKIGGHDKHQRLILFVWLRNMAKGHSLKTMMTWYMFETDYMVYSEPLSRLRNGLIWVMDVSGASVMRNLDTSADGRAWSREMSGTFPIRIRGIYAFNAGFFMRAILSVAKWILPKKLMDRIKVIDKKNLLDLVPAQHLPHEFGGQHTFDLEEKLRGIEPERHLVQKWRLQLGNSDESPKSQNEETVSQGSKKKKKQKDQK